MKKLNSRQVEDRLQSLGLKIFGAQDLRLMFKAEDRAIQGFLNYNTQKGIFIRLKRGLFAVKRDLPTDFALANKLYSPSYVSLDTALSYYGLIPETVYSITSITTKATREFVVEGRAFEYRKVKKEAYTGYLPKEIFEEIVFLATPEKAVADFLYFVCLGKRLYNDRLKLKDIDRKKLKEYLNLFGQKRLLVLFNRLWRQK